MPEHRNHARPRDHAVWAECADVEDRFLREPDHENKPERDADHEGVPEPAGEPGACQDRGADRDWEHKGAQADQRVREAEEFGLVGQHDRLARDECGEVAAERRVWVRGNVQALERQREGADPARDAADDENPG